MVGVGLWMEIKLYFCTIIKPQFMSIWVQRLLFLSPQCKSFPPHTHIFFYFMLFFYLVAPPTWSISVNTQLPDHRVLLRWKHSDTGLNFKMINACGAVGAKHGTHARCRWALSSLKWKCCCRRLDALSQCPASHSGDGNWVRECPLTSAFVCV